VCLLEAMRAQAAGESFAAMAQEALELARQADDLELKREARVLLHHASLMEDDLQSARAHLDAAVALREQVASGLPSDLHARFRARRDVAPIAALEAAFDRAHTELSVPPPAPSRSSSPPNLSPADRASTRSSAFVRMVGRDSAMLSLATAIRKVGATDA